MRLLTLNDDGKLVLQDFDDDHLPPYAILSHTWDPDNSKEVTFQDLTSGIAEGKAGYAKLRFCERQARQDGLQYFWVDTCCINKYSDPELSEAINSMFRWYQMSNKCYVFLTDVLNSEDNDAFRDSRWLKRGWTLQELIAPSVVEFYSADGSLLGDKSSLGAVLHELTGISIKALRGYPLSHFSTDERFSWAIGRQTKRPEDRAYSLLGIFDVSMPLIYGEGEAKASRRLRELVEGPRIHVISALPQARGAAFDSHEDEDEPKCHSDTRTGVLQDIAQWADEPDGKCIYWLYGAAGTGKSTVSRTVAHNFGTQGRLSASFFFKRGKGDRSNASRFFSTIAAQLAIKLPGMISHIASALEAEPGITEKSMETQCDKLILQPLSLLWLQSPAERYQAFIVIDALDECKGEAHVQTILGLLSRFRAVKGIDMRVFVTSRPDLPIHLGFGQIDKDVHEDVALHEVPDHIIDHDLRIVLASRLERIRVQHSIPSCWPGEDNLESLVRITRPLFIHAATVCRYISDTFLGSPEELLESIIQLRGSSSFSDLGATYHPVLHQLTARYPKSHHATVLQKFRLVAGTIVTLFNPLPKSAIAILLGLSVSQVSGVLDYLHSVLRVPNDETLPVQLFHLSFRDFLVDQESCGKDLWIDEEEAHARIANSCISIMSAEKGLRENICGLDYPGKQRREIDGTTIDTSISVELQYACCYWAQHLHRSGQSIRDGGDVHGFLLKHLLHLLEVMSLLGRISEAIDMVAKLLSLLDTNQSVQFSALLYDARRFVLAYRAIIDSAPLQVYVMLVVVPRNSTLYSAFESQIPRWIKQVHSIQSEWSSQIQILEGHLDAVTTFAYSPDGKYLASGSDDGMLCIWDLATGMLLLTLDDDVSVSKIAYSTDGKELVSVSYDGIVNIWNAEIGTLQRTIKRNPNSIAGIFYSPDSTQIILVMNDMTREFWEVKTETLMQTREGQIDWTGYMLYSLDGKKVASWLGRNSMVQIWDVLTDTLQMTLKTGCEVVAFDYSLNGKLVALGLSDVAVQIWDVSKGTLQQALKEGHRGRISAIKFSLDGEKMVSGSWDKTVRIWDVSTGLLLQTFEGHREWVLSVVFSPDGKQVVSGSQDGTVRIWDIETSELHQTGTSHEKTTMSTSEKGQVTSLTYLPNGKEVVSGWEDGTVWKWNIATGTPQLTSYSHDRLVYALASSQDGKRVASALFDGKVLIWCMTTGVLLCTLEGHSSAVFAIAFSPDGKQLVSGLSDRTLRLWDVTRGLLQATLEGHTYRVRAVTYSPNGTRIISGSEDMTMLIWDVATGSLMQLLEGHSSSVTAVTFSPDGLQVVSGSYDKTIRVWDANTGVQLRIFNGPNHWLDTIKYSPCGRYLLTDRSILYLDGGESSAGKADLTTSPMQLSSKLLIADDWLLLEGRKMLWFPPDYRTIHSAVHGDSITLGCHSGQVVIIELNWAV